MSSRRVTSLLTFVVSCMGACEVLRAVVAGTRRLEGCSALEDLAVM